MPVKNIFLPTEITQEKIADKYGESKASDWEIKAKVRPPEFVSRIVCCVALVSYNSHEIIRAAILRKNYSIIDSPTCKHALLFRTRLPLTRQYGFQNRDKVYMFPITVLFEKKPFLSFPWNNVTISI